jgi:hypothetical protein
MMELRTGWRLRYARAARAGVALALFGLSFPAPARADVYNVIFENDLFYRRDRDYTNGIEFNWSPSPDRDDAHPAWLAQRLPAFFARDDLRASYSLGQMMFTPEDTKASDPPSDMRPYAGYLYGAVALTGRAQGREDQLRIQLGMIGPASLAADSQDLVHRIRGFDLPQGWHTQLRDEPGLVISYRRMNALASIDSHGEHIFDLAANYGGALGNVFDYVDAGLTARLGFGLPDDSGPPQIDPSRPGSRIYQPQGEFGAYLFAGIQARAVARNLFLDGNSFQPSRSVPKEILVGDVSAGAALAFKRFRLSFMHVFRSREYRTQNGFDEFGTLALSLNF